MSFFCPWQDAQFERCRRTGDRQCRPGKPGCVLFGKVELAEEGPGRHDGPERAAIAKNLRVRESASGSNKPSRETRIDLLDRLEAFPSLLRADMSAVPGQTKVGRWTAAQVVHHLADVHASGLARVRRALTEVDPKVEPYDHESWARLEDAGQIHLLEASLAILEGTHARWVNLLRSLHEDGWARTYRRTQPRGRATVEEDLAWHVRHGDEHRRALLGAVPDRAGS